ncbi:hypothetical protein SISNIDRAFT_466919 [Sistotremastrum niveocremeum HHB9708]|uniref:DNA binding protein Ncp1 n=2 Tax=Sistotremastraceae TaxID=3402574 RepID=A0A164TR48_9AGAM|nr:hypothetical protein SISNIDRAFT_466919 [Sistotremastrum niveocremeum HHB9708]KZT42237.1 hypothetical protein SISSUDRAFT_1030719 [Sistotremastrum suecicum HHB10207 ss-3]
MATVPTPATEKSVYLDALTGDEKKRVEFNDQVSTAPSYRDEGNGHVNASEKEPLARSSMDAGTSSAPGPGAANGAASSPTQAAANGTSPSSTTPEPTNDRHTRALVAENSLSSKTRSRMSKVEMNEAKRMSKILQSEAKESGSALKVAMRELDTIQGVQKKAVRAESKATNSHAKAVKSEHKLNLKFIQAKAKWEQAAAELKAKTEALEAHKQQTAMQTKLLHEKTQEIEELRARKALEDREREAKIQALTVNPTGV